MVMVGELAIGLIAIAVAIGVGLFPIWYTLRGENKISKQIQKDIEQIKPLLSDIIKSGIDEKIAMFYTYETMAKGWQITRDNQLEIESKLLLYKMKSDIRALSKLKSTMTSDQKELAHSAIGMVIKELRNRAQNDIADEIQTTLTALLS